MPWWAWLFWSLSALLGLAALAILYLSLIHDRSRGRRRCPRCWYDMSGTPGLLCPECGRDARLEPRLYRTHRRYGLALIGLTIAALAYLAAYAPSAIRTGSWWSIVPMPLLQLAAPFFNSQGDALLQSSATATMINIPARNRWEGLLLARACARALEAINPEPNAPLPPPISPPSTAPGFPIILTPKHQALSVLQYLGDDAAPAIPTLVRLLRSRDPYLRHRTIEIIANMPISARRAIADIGPMVKDPDPVIRTGAVAALHGIAIRIGHKDPAKAPRFAPIIARALDNDDQTSRVAACRALSLLGPPDASYAPRIAATIRDPRISTGPVGINALGAFNQPGVPYLVEFLSDGRRPIERAAAAWIGQRLHEAPQSIPRLTELAMDSDHATRATALAAIYRHGPDARPALPILARIRAEDPSAQLRLSAFLAIDAIGGDDTIPHLTAALSDKDGTIRRNAAESLGRFGPRAASAIPALTTLAAQHEFEGQLAAAQALKLINP